MPDNCCNICLRKFKSPYHLKRHNNNKNQCSPPDLDTALQLETDSNTSVDNSIDSNGGNNQKIINLFKQIIKMKSINEDTLKLFNALIEDEIQAKYEINLVNKAFYKCSDCNQEFAQRQGLYKHNKYNRCKAKKDGYSLDDIMQNAPIDTITANNTPTVNLNDIDNSNVHVDASQKIINNNNYNFNIQPFGLESLEHITLKDFKHIFADSDKLMYNLCNYVFLQNQANMSFYKHNLNKQIISFLSKNMEIEKIDEKGFIIQFTRLLEDTCILLFYQHREHLTENELIKYMKRLVQYQDTILYEKNSVIQTDTKNCILNLMDTAFRNKDIKYNIEKIIKDLKANLYDKNDIIERLTDEEYKRDDVINEFYNKRTSTTHKMQHKNVPANKILNKIREKAMTQNNDDVKAIKKRAAENAFKDVKFRTSEEAS